MDYDIKIQGGMLVDGSGARARAGDLGIRDGRVVAVGEAPGRARETIEAKDRAVAPGFIDIHTHYDAQVIWDPMLSISPWHGVTSVVAGNCGFGIAPTRPEHRELMIATLEKVEGMSADALAAGLGDWPFETFPEYLRAIDRKGVAINVGVLLGHTPLRLYVMGREAVEREATGEEVARMRAIAADAMAAGAIGFSSSTSPLHLGFEGRPVPSRLAAFEEVRTLAGVLRDAGTGVFQTAVSDEPDHAGFAQIAAETGRPLTWTALLTRAGEGPQYIHRHLAETETLRARGLPIYPQVSCRPLTTEMRFLAPFSLERMAMFAPVSKADAAGKKRIYADPDFRAALKYELDPEGGRERDGYRVRFAWEKSVISFCEQAPELEDRKLVEAAAERGVHTVDLALDLALGSDLMARFRMPVANAEEDQVADLLRDPNTILGLSDAGAHASQLCDACYATHLLGYWVRQKGVLSLEEAVRMLTSATAEVFGIAERGRLARGYAADVVVFDPDTVGAAPLERVNDFPAGADRLISRAEGIEAVLVNGTLLRRDGIDMIEDPARLPGRTLRNGRAAS